MLATSEEDNLPLRGVVLSPIRNKSRLDLFDFARSSLKGVRSKLVSVIVLDTILMSITGVGLLLILPLLGLLGFGSGASDNAIWNSIRSVLHGFGLDLTLEVGLGLFPDFAFKRGRPAVTGGEQQRAEVAFENTVLPVSDGEQPAPLVVLVGVPGPL